MISKTAIHAIKALATLAEDPDTLQGAGSIADRIGASRNYLGKLLQSLADEGLVYSQKGKGGGFKLSRDPADISLYEIVEPVDHVSRWSGCFLGLGACTPDTPCAMHEKWASVREAYLTMLETSTLADVVEQRVTLTSG